MNKTQKLTRMALVMAIEVILGCTPLGFIAVPPVSITTMHIPVIVGSIVLGSSYGSVLGLTFGVISMCKAIITPTNILFSPVLSGNPIASVVMCILPRILLGIIPGLLYNGFKKMHMAETLNLGISAALSTIIHTFSVLFCMVVLFKGMLLADVFAYIVGVNGVSEMVVAVIVSIAVCKPLIKLFKKE